MEKIYYQDTHITDFTAHVAACRPEADGRYGVLLDRTAFFPEEGGQGPDSGTLGGLDVLDVRIRGDEIWHTVASPLPEGSAVEGHVDWAQRFDYMQQHTGEHIVSGLVHAAYGYDNVGFHLGKEEVTLDFNGPLTLAQMREIEAKANEVIWRCLPVRVSFPEPDVLAGLEYRSKLALTENVRIVEIPGVDICACCAPHTDSTGQIGLLKVTNVQSHRGGVRVNILCGGRALRDYTLRQDSVNEISVLLSAKQEAVSGAVARLKEEAGLAKQRAGALQAQILTLQAAALPSPEENPNAVLFTGELDNLALRNMVNSLCERFPGYCAVFSGTEEGGYRYIIGSASLDCRKMAGLLRERFGAKGGGTAPMVQGSISAAKEAICSVFKEAICSAFREG